MLPAHLPCSVIVPKVPSGRRTTIRALCQEAGLDCRVTGPSAERVVYLRSTPVVEIHREPGVTGDVAVGSPETRPRERAVLALGALAYVVFDYAARESMRGRPEAATAPPLGRPRVAHPLSGAERQRRWRAKKIR